MKPDGVRIVDHHQGVVLVGQIADAGQVGDDAVHRKDAVGGDHAEPGAGRLLELLLQVGHVVVLVAEPLGLAEPHAVDDAGVVQLVGDDRVFGAEERLEQPAVGVEARRVEDRVLRAEELAELPLRVACGSAACRR